MSGDQYSLIGRRMIIIAWLMFFGVLGLFFYYFENPQPSNAELEKGKIILTADRQGHYRVKGTINEYSVEFIIDTGATMVAIPENIAGKIGLKGQYPIRVTTANGTAMGSVTRIKQLTFGQFTLNNVKAIISPTSSDDMILLGMNVLSQFTITQHRGKLEIKK